MESEEWANPPINLKRSITFLKPFDSTVDFEYTGKTFKKTDFQVNHDFDEPSGINEEINIGNENVRHTLKNGTTVLTGGGVITEELRGISRSQSDSEEDVIGFDETENQWQGVPNLATAKKK